MIKRKARKELGATKAGDLIFTFPNVSENTHLMINADNSVTGLSTSDLGAEVLSSTMSDIVPAIDGVYDIGATDFRWYDGFFSNSVDIDGGVIQGAAGAISVNDVLIVDNVLSQISTPLYGNREIVTEGGFTIASTDPAYLRLTQLPSLVPFDPISVDGSNMYYSNLYYWEDYSSTGKTRFRWDNSYGPDVSSLVVGQIYTVQWRDSGYYLYTANLEFSSTSVSMGLRDVDFISPNPGSYSNYYIWQGANAIVITGSPTEDFTTVLDTFGSEGMIRFHPVTKTFEGHDGTAWSALGASDVFVSGTNIGSTLTGTTTITGCFNNFLGNFAGQCNTTGCQNNFFGRRAGRYNTTGSYNIFLGSYAGASNIVGVNNIAIGYHSGYGSYGIACINGNHRIVLGNSFHTCAQIQVAWTVPSDVRDKCIFGSVPHGRGFLENVNTIEYAFKNRETNEITDPRRRYGFCAQEILSLEGNDPVIVGNENPDKLGLTTEYLIPILVNGFKELSAEVKQLRAEIDLLKNPQ